MAVLLPGGCDVDHFRSRHSRPFDPLLFGMLGARAMALMRVEHFDEAVK